MIRRCPRCGAFLVNRYESGRGMTAICPVCRKSSNLDEERKEYAEKADAAFHLMDSFQWDEASKSFFQAYQDSKDWAYLWPAILCKYGILYVHDSFGEWVPTCAKTSISMDRIEDRDEWKYLWTEIETKPSEIKEWFTKERLQLDRMFSLIRRHEEDKPFDLFLCFSMHERTMRFVSMLYKQLLIADQDARVFFAPKTLEGITEEMFEPLLYNALRTARRFCIVLGSGDHPVTLWMQNEIERYAIMHPETNPFIIRLPGTELNYVPQNLMTLRQEVVGSDESLSEAKILAVKLMENIPDESSQQDLEEETEQVELEIPKPIFEQNELSRIPPEFGRFLLGNTFTQKQRFSHFKQWFEKNEGMWNTRHLSRFNASVGRETVPGRGIYVLSGYGVGVFYCGMKLESEDGRYRGTIKKIIEDRKETEWVACNSARMFSIILSTSYDTKKINACLWQNG